MARKSSLAQAIAALTAVDDEGTLNVIVETPQGSRNKFNFDKEHGLFKLGGVLPSGAVFPYDFGFVPQTLGEDGDPLDVLVLMDEPAFAGCWVPTRLIGAIEAEQTEDKNTTRNDRLITVAKNSRNHKNVESIDQLSENLVAEIEHFFASYNQMKGKEFHVLGRADAKRAMRIVQDGHHSYCKENQTQIKRKQKPR